MFLMKRISICWPNHFSHVSRNLFICSLVNIFEGKWKKLWCQVNICLQFPKIYEKVTCYVCMDNVIMFFLNNTIGVKQGFPLSPTIFGLCIDELERMVAKFVNGQWCWWSCHWECNHHVFVVSCMWMIWCCCKYFRRCAKAYEGTGRILHAYEVQCQQTLKQRWCLWTTIKRNRALGTIMRQFHDIMESFKYVGLEVPSTHRWNELVICHLEGGNRA